MPTKKVKEEVKAPSELEAVIEAYKDSPKYESKKAELESKLNSK